MSTSRSRVFTLFCLAFVFATSPAWTDSLICSDLAQGGAEPRWCAIANRTEMPESGDRTAEKAAGDTGWSWDFFTGNLGSFPLNNFPAFSAVGSNLGLMFALDFDPTSTILYALDSDTMQFGTLSLANATFTAIGPSAPTAPGHNVWSGLTIHPVTGAMYASGIAGSVNVAYGLYAIDPATGTPTLIGTDATTMAMIDIAINCQGDMYGHDIITDSIYQIDPADGSATLIGATGVDSNFAQGMDFDNEAGVLYAWTYQGGGANQFGTINLDTGALTTLFTTNPSGEWEGAVQNVCVAMPLIFADGFESGDTTAWSSTVP